MYKLLIKNDFCVTDIVICFFSVIFVLQSNSTNKNNVEIIILNLENYTHGCTQKRLMWKIGKGSLQAKRMSCYSTPSYVRATTISLPWLETVKESLRTIFENIPRQETRKLRN